MFNFAPQYFGVNSEGDVGRYGTNNYSNFGQLLAFAPSFFERWGGSASITFGMNACYLRSYDSDANSFSTAVYYHLSCSYKFGGSPYQTLFWSYAGGSGDDLEPHYQLNWSGRKYNWFIIA